MLDPALARHVAATAGTPAYVYDLADARDSLAALRDAVPEGTDTYYSVKANRHPELLRALHDAGSRAEVCSPGELTAALAAGWEPGAILYAGPGKRDLDLRTALAAGVRHFSVDSPYALDQLNRCAQAAGAPVRCLLRINADAPASRPGLTMTGVSSPFGADARWVASAPERFGHRPHVTVVGLHLYMGTNLTTVDDLFAQFTSSLRTAADLREALRARGVRLDVLDLGGGFGAPFARAGRRLDLSGLREPLTALLDAEVPAWREGRPRIAFESGRYLVGTAGTLLTRVLDAKTSHGSNLVVLESGINHLGGLSGLRRLPPLVPSLIPVDAAAPPADTVPTTVCGPLCTPLDVWARGVELPRLGPGDLLAVPNVGAYGLDASLIAFLGHPPPVEVVIDSTTPDPATWHVSRLDLVRTPIALGEPL
ncbi:alanine racemase [Micromonospora sp. WMMD1120]|uniref:alanine racemase n=1 Tax=Micromonospora sp. WMMD1120 TaxID=3016106 RepID=UPI0024163648|nr:alanine racemase [Micromonospora sp. WMMD1120]MDG4809357.1 alanine racemase [Micromonospora sp. WMMD1120]